MAVSDGQAKTAYEEGIAASMERWGLADGSTVRASWGKDNSFTTGTTGIPGKLYDLSCSSACCMGWNQTQTNSSVSANRNGQQCLDKVSRLILKSEEPDSRKEIFEYELEGAYYKNLGLPIRLQYALSEDTYNTDNVAAARLAQSIEAINEGMFSTDGIKSQVWWHTRKNPIPTETDVH